MNRMLTLLMALAISGLPVAGLANAVVPKESKGTNDNPTADVAARRALRKAAIDKLVTNETEVAHYTLEDPLVFANGKRVASPEQWPARRSEILDIFAKEMYGQPPPAPETVLSPLNGMISVCTSHPAPASSPIGIMRHSSVGTWVNQL